MIDEERQDLPSASKFSRLEQCPGSHLLEIAIKKAGKIPIEADSDAASQGRAGHEMLALWARDPSAMEDEVTWTQEARAIWDKMSPLTRETYWRATEQAEELLRRYGAVDAGGNLLPATYVEKRFRAIGLYSAQIDAFWYFTTDEGETWTAFLPDWKTLFGNYSDASSNLQLMAQIGSMRPVLNSCDTLYAAIIQPNKGKPTVTKYDRSHIRDAAATSRAIAASALDPNAPRKAGDQCKLCDCRAHCPEAQASQESLVALTKSPLSIQQVLEASTPERLAEMMVSVKTARAVAEAIEAEVRRRVEAGESLVTPDSQIWTVGKGKTLRPVEDVSRLWAQAVASVPAFSAEDMMKCVKVGKEDFDAVLREKSGLSGRQHAKAWKTLKDVVYSGCVAEVDTRGSLQLEMYSDSNNGAATIGACCVVAVEEIEQTEDEQ